MADNNDCSLKNNKTGGQLEIEGHFSGQTNEVVRQKTEKAADKKEISLPNGFRFRVKQ
ncbi:hypothetical protein [Niabella sp.]|uniref:hypothetical protein n=1 Tax=Niabella sp. TaxID=1962976 RepID=UPI0026126AA5|nr:hypothetical protein [Niabella sp.]